MWLRCRRWSCCCLRRDCCCSSPRSVDWPTTARRPAPAGGEDGSGERVDQRSRCSPGRARWDLRSVPRRPTGTAVCRCWAVAALRSDWSVSDWPDADRCSVAIRSVCSADLDCSVTNSSDLRWSAASFWLPYYYRCYHLPSPKSRKRPWSGHYYW